MKAVKIWNKCSDSSNEFSPHCQYTRMEFEYKFFAVLLLVLSTKRKLQWQWTDNQIQGTKYTKCSFLMYFQKMKSNEIECSRVYSSFIIHFMFKFYQLNVLLKVSNLSITHIRLNTNIGYDFITHANA